MHIRPMEAKDIAAVHAMIVKLSAYHNDHDNEVTHETIARDGLGSHPWIRFLVAEGAQGVVAYAALLPLAKVKDGWRRIDINHMYVEAAHRGTGIGRALIEAAAKVAADLGCVYMFIGTAPDNTAAQDAYLKCGFERWTSSGPRFRRTVPQE